MKPLYSFPHTIQTAYLVWNILRNLGFDADAMKTGVSRDAQMFLQLRTQGRAIRFLLGGIENTTARRVRPLCESFSERLNIAPVDELLHLLNQAHIPHGALFYATVQNLQSKGFIIPEFIVAPTHPELPN